MASGATSTNASTSTGTTVAQAAGHAVVKTVAAVASQVQKGNSADLKDIVSNVSKEVVAAKSEDAPTLIEKVEGGSKELAKDIVMGVESAAEEVEAHPELVAEGAVVAAVGAVGLVTPALAVGGVAVIGKMAADSAMKTLDGIVTDSSSKVVKEISSDLAKDVGDVKKSTDTTVATNTEVTVSAKAVKTTNGDSTTAGANHAATTNISAAQNVTAATTKTEAVGPKVAISGENPVTPNVTQSVSNCTTDKSVDQKSAATETPDPGNRTLIAAAVAVGYKQPFVSPDTSSSPTHMAAPAMAPTPAVAMSKVAQDAVTISTTTQPTALNQERHSTSQQSTNPFGSTGNDHLTDLHQKLDSIQESLQHEDLTKIYEKMDAMHATLQTIATLLASIAQGQAQLQAQSQASVNSKSQSAAETSTRGIHRPLSLITPPLPPTTVETRSEMALENAHNVNAVASNAQIPSSPSAMTGGDPSKRSGIFDGLGKLLYLRN